MKQRTLVFALVALIVLTVLPTVMSAQQPVSQLLLLPHAKVNTNNDGPWQQNRIVRVKNVCAEKITVRHTTYLAEHRSKVLSRKQKTLESGHVLALSLRDLLRESDEYWNLLAEKKMAPMDLVEVVMEIATHRPCLAAHDSFGIHSGAIFGTQLWSLRPFCLNCNEFTFQLTDYHLPNGGGHTEEIVVWRFPFSSGTFNFRFLDNKANTVAERSLRITAASVSIPLSDFNLPDDYNFGTVEVSCPTRCVVRYDTLSLDNDLYGHNKQREEVYATQMCLPKPPMPPPPPFCKSLSVVDTFGDNRCISGKICRFGVTFAGDLPITVPGEEKHLPQGLSLTKVTERTFEVFGITSDTESECEFTADNGCSAIVYRCSVTEEEPPKCTEDVFAIVTAGSTKCTFGENCKFQVDVTAGTPRYDIILEGDASDGMDTVPLDEDSFLVFGVPTQLGEGIAAVVNGCSKFEIPFTVTPPEDLPMCLSFTAKPSTVESGDKVTLTWETNEPPTTGVTIEPIGFIGPASGTTTDTPTEDTTYVLTAHDREHNEDVCVAKVEVEEEPPPPPPKGDEGCTPGYWKKHTDSWPAAGFSPSQLLPSVFAQSAAYPELASASLLEALNFGGGSGVNGAARNLMRAAVAALLDASHPGVNYPRTPMQVISKVNGALDSGDRDTMLTVASGLDRDNNLGCPLN